jgi:pimeloyl-ACP methyl ester carboxylesterase
MQSWLDGAQEAAPLVIADQGHFWVGIRRMRLAHGQVAAGQMFVQYQIPAELRQPYPIVMVHGGGGQGTDYLMTPDGRPGWADYFLRHGFAVYVVDRPGFGRSPFLAEAYGPASPPSAYEFVTDRFTAPEKAASPAANAFRHTQWPGSGQADDPALDQFMASQDQYQAPPAALQAAAKEAGAQLLDRIGPSVIVTHSSGGPFGWLVADARPQLVRGIIAIEPIGPAFADLRSGKLSWGLTSVPMEFDPPAESPADLRIELRKAPQAGFADCMVQAEPARKLPNLRGIPIVVVTAEASFAAPWQHGVVDFLNQAGAIAGHLRLEEAGIHGNGHLMMLEKNSDVIAAALVRWLNANAR